MELSDSEEDEVLENGGMEVEEEEDLAQWTISTFKPRPLKGENAANIVSCRSLECARKPADNNRSGS